MSRRSVEMTNGMDAKMMKEALEEELAVLHLKGPDIHEEIGRMYEVYGNTGLEPEEREGTTRAKFRYGIVAAICALAVTGFLGGYGYAKGIDLKYEISRFLRLTPEQEQEYGEHFQQGKGDVIASDSAEGVDVKISEVFYTKQTFSAIVEVSGESDQVWDEDYKFQNINVKPEYRDGAGRDLYGQEAYNKTSIRVLERGEGNWKGLLFCNLGDDMQDVESLQCTFDTFGKRSLENDADGGYVEKFADGKEASWDLHWKVDYEGDETVKEISQRIHCEPYVADWKITNVYLSPFSITCQVQPADTDTFENRENGPDFGDFIRGILWSDGTETEVRESEGKKPGTVLQSDTSLNGDKTVGTATVIFREVQSAEEIQGIVLSNGEKILFQ